MRRRTAPRGPMRRLAGLVAVTLLSAAWMIDAPRPALAGLTCDAGMNCATLGISAPGLGAGTVTGHGINCAVDDGVKTLDCSQDYNFPGAYLVVDLTITAAEGSVYITSTGGRAGPGVPVVESVLLLPDDENTQYKEVRFDLGFQAITLVIKGAGSGVVRHSEVGVTCPPDCIVRYEYGETGIIFVADPDPGSFFKSWSGPCAGQPAACQFDMPKSTTMTVTFGLTPTATPKAATPKPSVAATAPPTLEPSPSVVTPSAEPSATGVASAAPTTGSTPTTDPLDSPSPSGAPVSPTDADGGFGSGLLVGLLAAGVIAVVGAFLLWRRRAAPLP